MTSRMKSIVMRLLALALIGCAGSNFVRPNTDALKLGQTTYVQIVQQFGQPRREGTVLKNDRTVRAIFYAYAALGGEGLHAGVVPARGMTYYFSNDVLVGYTFVSSWKEDNTDFDEKKIDMITKGKSTRPEVITLMGKPSGYYAYPLIKSDSGQAMVYSYAEALLNRTSHRKSLAVSFDNGGVVSEVEFTASEGQ